MAEVLYIRLFHEWSKWQILSLLCSEGNTEHIELMMIGEKNIKVAQYLTELPEKKWFADKLQRAIAIAKEYHETKGTNS